MRAFSDKRYDYYKLTQPLGFNNSGYGIKDYILPKGAIFVHDKSDDIRGSIAEGCLKLCWTPDGNSYGCLGGDSMCFHACFRNTDLFELVQSAETAKKKGELENLIRNLENQLQEAKKQLKEIRI